MNQLLYIREIDFIAVINIGMSMNDIYRKVKFNELICTSLLSIFRDSCLRLIILP
jgi:hypothetical protein